MSDQSLQNVASLMTEVASLRGVALGYKARAEKAEAELEALRADAERYRWIRANLYKFDAITGGPFYGIRETAIDARVDAAIDAAKVAP